MVNIHVGTLPPMRVETIFHLNWGESLAIHSDQGGCHIYEVILFNVTLVASWMKRHQNLVKITNNIEYCQAIYA